LCHGCGHLSCSRNAFVDACFHASEDLSGPGPSSPATGMGNLARFAVGPYRGNAGRGYPARPGRLARPAYRRCGRSRHATAPADRRGAALAGAALRLDGGGRAGAARRVAARPVGATGVVAGAAGAEGQHAHPGEGSDPVTDAVRGLGILRQAGARASRGLDTATGAGQQVARAGAEPDFAGQLRRAAGAFFALGAGHSGGGRVAGVLRRGAFFR
jgi:hypothetical protein